MSRKLKVSEEVDPMEQVAEERENLEEQLVQLQRLYDEMNMLGIRSISDLEVKMSYLQRDIQKLS